VIADVTPPGSLQWEWTWELEGTPEKVWPLVSDTNRFNRDTGLPTVDDAREGVELRNARRRLRMVVKGVPVEWEELPFEWVRPWRFGVVRHYQRGPLREMRVRATLTPLGEDRSTLVYSVAARPRGPFGWVAAKLQIGVLSRRAFGRIFREYGRHVAETGQSAPPPARPGVPAAISRREGRLLEAGADARVVSRLLDFVGRADDLSLVRMRPFTLARLWDLPRETVLEGFLFATRVGLLELRWDLLCPNCRGTKGGAPTLADLRSSESVHCDTCLIDFDVDFDRSVELVFSPNPDVREVPNTAFCVAGPQITPHILGQQLLHPGETRDVEMRLQPGSYRARTLDAEAASSFRVAEGARAEGLSIRIDSESLGVEGAATVTPDVTLRIANDSEEEKLLVVESTSWAEDALTAAEVTASARFRDLFSSEVLAAGEFVSVGTQTILFTDLEASTSLYREIGDAPAFGRVVGHFEVLSAAIEGEGGTVVKTIGDAVMAVFPRPAPAIRSVVEARNRLAASTESTPLRIKAGLHEGPAIIVTLNERLDYFGTTVNVAARLGGLATGDDIVVSERVHADPEVRGWLETADGVSRATPFDARLRGLDDPVRAVRVRTRHP